MFTSFIANSRIPFSNVHQTRPKTVECTHAIHDLLKEEEMYFPLPFLKTEEALKIMSLLSQRTSTNVHFQMPANYALPELPETFLDDESRSSSTESLYSDSFTLTEDPKEISEQEKFEQNANESRGGKYRKKPAPKAPEHYEDTQKSVKATLVIKSGTLTTITKVSDEKVEPRKKETKSSSFSKLLTLPKNIFHQTFHGGILEHRSRSSSFIGNKSKGDMDVENILRRAASAGDDNSYVSLRSDSIDNNCPLISGGLEKRAKKKEKMLIRQLSHSPTRGSDWTES